MPLPELEEFRREVAVLREDGAISATKRDDGRYALSTLSLSEVERLLSIDPAYYLLLAATSLNRTSLRVATLEPEAQLVPPRQRKAFAVRTRLPVSADFDALVASAVGRRGAHRPHLLPRRDRGVHRVHRPDDP